MIINKKDINRLDKSYKINLINSIVGAKSANLVSSLSRQGVDNIAVFSSVIHLGSTPPLVGFIIRPQETRITDTYRNIKYLKRYGISSISSKMIAKSHLTSKKTESAESEYELFNIEKDYIDNFPVPFAKESQIKIGLKFIEEKFIVNKCRLIVGEVEIVKINSSITKNGNLNFEKDDGITITGISTYNKIKDPIEMPYVKSK
tara:strand:+ start:1969 stop:2577 length:609 start_codon:yes stop_codon:yes gene_type:complete